MSPAFLLLLHEEPQTSSHILSVPPGSSSWCWTLSALPFSSLSPILIAHAEGQGWPHLRRNRVGPQAPPSVLPTHVAACGWTSERASGARRGPCTGGWLSAWRIPNALTVARQGWAGGWGGGSCVYPCPSSPTPLCYGGKSTWPTLTINHFGVCSPVAPGPLTALCNRHLCLVPGDFHHPKRKPRAQQQSRHIRSPGPAPSECFGLVALPVLDASCARVVPPELCGPSPGRVLRAR